MTGNSEVVQSCLTWSYNGLTAEVPPHGSGRIVGQAEVILTVIFGVWNAE